MHCCCFAFDFKSNLHQLSQLAPRISPLVWLSLACVDTALVHAVTLLLAMPCPTLVQSDHVWLYKKFDGQFVALEWAHSFDFRYNLKQVYNNTKLNHKPWPSSAV